MSGGRKQGTRRGDARRAAIPVRAAGSSPRACTDAEPFALRVTDDSMAPEFPAGSIVIVDPTVAPAEGRFVVAETHTGITLGRLGRRGDGWQLERLAGDAGAVPLDACAIRGAVTQRAGRRRRDHKRYP